MYYVESETSQGHSQRSTLLQYFSTQYYVLKIYPCQFLFFLTAALHPIGWIYHFLIISPLIVFPNFGCYSSAVINILVHVSSYTCQEFNKNCQKQNCKFKNYAGISIVIVIAKLLSKMFMFYRNIQDKFSCVQSTQGRHSSLSLGVLQSLVITIR